ncbi:MAG TPA: histidine--tRNA ligase family protein, partial [Bacteroidetes bacterium]|nr:histidine--tRNA ligase family protein [Bacteroidota bacterium]
HTNSVLRTIDKIEKHGFKKTIQELGKIGISADRVKVIQKLLEISGSNEQIISQLLSFKVKSPMFKTGVEELAFVVKQAILFGVSGKSLKIDLTIVRGLDYYTGTVYETVLNNYPEIGSICSGGRYDDLISKFGDVKLSGVGVSIGLSRLFYQLQEAGILKGSQFTPSKVLVVQIGDKVLEYCIKVVTELRKNGINSEIYLESKKMKKSMRYANRLKVPYVIIIGEEEVANNLLTLIIMETGDQSKLSLMEAIQTIEEG